MTSAMASKSSLDRVFEFMKICEGDREEIKKEFRIDTVTKLIQSRSSLSACRNNAACRVVVFGIDFIKLHLQNSSNTINEYNVDALFTSTERIASSWKRFLMSRIEESMKRSSETVVEDDTASSTTTNSSISTIENETKSKEVHFEWAEEDIDDDNDFDMEFDEELEFDQDSPWELDSNSHEVYLKKKPESVRVPVTLYKMLFDYQRLGVAWIIQLFLDKTGGILGE